MSARLTEGELRWIRRVMGVPAYEPGRERLALASSRRRTLVRAEQPAPQSADEWLEQAERVGVDVSDLKANPKADLSLAQAGQTSESAADAWLLEARRLGVETDGF